MANQAISPMLQISDLCVSIEDQQKIFDRFYRVENAIHTEIGTGLIDHSYYLEMMEKVCPDGDILIEHIPSNKFKSAYEKVNNYSEKLQINWQSYKS